MSKRESAVFAVRLAGEFPVGAAGMTNAIPFSLGGNGVNTLPPLLLAETGVSAFFSA